MLTQSLDGFLSESPIQKISTKKRKRLTKEYEEISREPNLTYFEKTKKYKSAIEVVNRTRNRYSNILPPEETRVKLHDMQNDYINANYITIQTEDCEMKYISTQAPIPRTYSHFWKMVWDQKSSIIMLLTKFTKGKAKCYWGKKNSPKIFNYKMIGSKELSLIVTYKNRVKLDCGILRIFEIKKDQESRRIFHIQYNEWGDHKQPSSIKDIKFLIGYMEIFALIGCLNGLDGPPIIHCSAGVGRTGTFIACATIKTLVFRNKKVDIPAIVSQMRHCRTGMVQTDDQYIFIYLFHNHYIL